MIGFPLFETITVVQTNRPSRSNFPITAEGAVCSVSFYS